MGHQLVQMGPRLDSLRYALGVRFAQNYCQEQVGLRVTESWQTLAQSQHWTCLLKEFSPGQARPHSHTAAAGALWQLQRLLEWLKIILSSPLSEAVTISTDASVYGTAAYCTKDCQKVEHAVFAAIQRAEHNALVNPFFQSCSLLGTCLYPCFVSHLCSHSNLSGPLPDGNIRQIT
jgi:hypothetical protein